MNHPYRRSFSTIRCLGIAAGVLFAGAACAISVDIPAPAGVQYFGSDIVVLPNGNFLVRSQSPTDSYVSSVHLYSASGTLISTLTGRNLGYPIVLKNGNFLIKSAAWANGDQQNAGAVTWGSAQTGVSGEVSSANSLVGTSANDRVGGLVTVLENGNYVVGSHYWHNGGLVSAGAATWGNGTTGIVGEVSSSNSLVGTHAEDNVGEQVTALRNGHYVVGSPRWNGNQGAATWADGSAPTVGTIAVGNSLLGYRNGWGGIVALTNGNYVVASPGWANSQGDYVGAVMWCDGAAPTVGLISSDRALVGSTPGDGIGERPVIALSNGNYVTVSTQWHNGAVANAGAVTWGNGASGTTGVVSPGNSLVGSTSGDMFENQTGSITEVAALSNGNYVVYSPGWDNGAIANAGAATWGDGSAGTAGVISAANSLVGTSVDDHVGNYVTPLSNGHYVVASVSWNNGATPNVGAATWANGNMATTGAVSPANSLIGTSANDYVGYAVALSNGNYVVYSARWNNGAAAEAGAVTWGDGSAGTRGVVSPTNSLVGSTAHDGVGFYVWPLSNGHYVAVSPLWDGAVADLGAVTWGNGRGGTVGAVVAGNSLTGSLAGERLGGQFYGDTFISLNVFALANGNYMLLNRQWSNTYTNSAALARGTGPLSTTISTENAVLGGSTGDYDPVHDQLVVGRSSLNVVTLFKLDALFRDGWD